LREFRLTTKGVIIYKHLSDIGLQTLSLH
jgi:hypothetical protein